MIIIFRKWIDGTISVCNGTNHYRQYPDGQKKWFEGCPYSNPEAYHKKLKAEARS